MIFRYLHYYEFNAQRQQVMASDRGGICFFFKPGLTTTLIQYVMVDKQHIFRKKSARELAQHQPHGVIEMNADISSALLEYLNWIKVNLPNSALCAAVQECQSTVMQATKHRNHGAEIIKSLSLEHSYKAKSNDKL